MGHLKSFASILALLPLLGVAASHAAPHGDAEACAALAGKSFGPGKIESATWKPDGDVVTTSASSAKVTLPFCRVIGVAAPTADSHIGFEVWLPPASGWNGNFRGEGSGGSAGNISPGPMNDALAGGYATMSTDNGHVDPPGGNYGLDWAYQHPQKLVDWSWRALHLSTLAAKDVIKNFYGKPAGKNYFVACSAGGHHALMEATRFPADYDGMVAGAAPWKWTALMLAHTWDSIPALKDPSAVTAQSVAILNRRMTKACDKLDGVQDGLIADPRRCTVDPVEFQCKPGETADCLTPAQVDAARHIYAGATRADGTRLQQGMVRGSELGWVPLITGARPGGSSWYFWKDAVFQDPDFKNVNFDFDRDTDKAMATKIAGQPLAQVYDQKPDLRAYAKRGGKIILFHGTADFQISPLVDIDFYNRIVALQGPEKTDAFLRFFLIPGMGHCSGGIGFSHIGGATGAPIKPDPDHDMVRALDSWVARGDAPSLFIAARLNDKKEVTATRPVCRYPLEATYVGHGDAASAANFVCRPAEKLPPQPM
jgi:feruloyl esterase